MPDWTTVTALLRERGIDTAPAARPRPVSGGDIDAAWRLETADGPLFVKTCAAGDFDRLTAEAEGLAELSRAAEIRVPRVAACAADAATAVLALEWLDFDRESRGDADLGTQLAALHRHTHERFGWHRDNYIGLTPQINAPDDDWCRFYRDRRLAAQLDLAAEKGFGGALQDEGRRLLTRLDRFLDHAPDASLLHGDLWAGNRASAGGRPVVFDPAVYHGDRETDLAMTRLFGGFGEAFYAAYEKAWPLPPGHRERAGLYELYHVLNHLNLFGAGYLGRALAMIRALTRH